MCVQMCPTVAAGTDVYERSSLIVSSNKSFPAWAEIFDAVAVAARVERLVHHAEVIVLPPQAPARPRSFRLVLTPSFGGSRESVWASLVGLFEETPASGVHQRAMSVVGSQ